MRYLLLLLLVTCGFAVETPDLGTSPVPISGGGAGVFSSVTDSGLTSGRVTTAGTGGLLKDYAGLAIVGTPSATAPDAGTNGPGLLAGIVYQAADAVAPSQTVVGFGNGVAQQSSFAGYACQGTAASPGATIQNDGLSMLLRGYDGTSYTASAAAVKLIANSTWTNTNHESYIAFNTTPNGSTAGATRGAIASGGQLMWGGNFATGTATFTGGTVTPNVQVVGNNSVNAAIQSITLWRNVQSNAGTLILAKSRSATPGTPTVVTTADVLGLIDGQGDDGTNFVSSGQIKFLCEGTIGAGQVPGVIRVSTANSAGTMTTCGQWDSNQALVLGVGASSSGTFSAGTLRPHLQTSSTAASNAGIVQTMWNASSTGPTGIFAKSRSGTAGTQGVITTGDTLGTLSWQGDDGTNFINAADISAVATGTLGTGQIPGQLTIRTASTAGAMTGAIKWDSSQSTLVGPGAVTSTVYTGGTVTPRVQVVSNSAILATESLSCFTANAVAGSLYFGKARSGTIGTMTLVNASDALGTIDFQGADGTNFVSGAQIVATTTGTPASTRVGGQLVFKTGTDAAPTVMTAAETISNTQTVTWNGTTEASSATVANCVDSGGLAVAKRTFAGTIGTTFSGNVLAGVQDGTADTAGAVGEVLTAAQSTPTNFTTTNTIQNLTSISLTRGRWLETATLTLAMNGATEVAAAEAACYLDDTTASATGAVEGETIGYLYEPASTSSVHATVTIIFQENISAAKTKYLNAKAVWTAGTPQYTCSMKAVRLR